MIQRHHVTPSSGGYLLHRFPKPPCSDTCFKPSSLHQWSHRRDRWWRRSVFFRIASVMLSSCWFCGHSLSTPSFRPCCAYNGTGPTHDLLLPVDLPLLEAHEFLTRWTQNGIRRTDISSTLVSVTLYISLAIHLASPNR